MLDVVTRFRVVTSAVEAQCVPSLLSLQANQVLHTVYVKKRRFNAHNYVIEVYVARLICELINALYV